MALDPNKKKPPQGTQIGNLTLIPGSGLDDAIKAIGAHQASVTNSLAAADRANQLRPQVITADSGQVPDKVFKAPLPLPAAPSAPSTIKPVLIDPSNAASMQLTPPSRADAYPARTPAVPASQAGASAPVGGGAAPIPRPVSVNLGAGTDLGGGGVVRNSVASSVKNGVPTYDNASIDRLNARLAQPAVTATAGNSAPLAMPTAQPNLNVPGIDLPSVNTSRVSDAERERATLAKSLDDQLSRMNFQGLDNIGKRQLFAELMGTRAGLSRQGGELAGGAAGQALAAATQAGTATQAQVGENGRALLSDQGQTTRANLSEQGANSRAMLQSLTELQKPTQITDTNGNLLSVTGTQGAVVTGPDGKPVQPLQAKADGAVTPLAQYEAASKTYDTLLANAPVTPDPNYTASLAEAKAQRDALAGNGRASQAPSATPNLAAYKAAARKAGYTQSDAELEAAFNRKYPQGK